jgi:hypothetical protein
MTPLQIFYFFQNPLINEYQPTCDSEKGIKATFSGLSETCRKGKNPCTLIVQNPVKGLYKTRPSTCV